MAERRMFSRAIIGSGRFLQMPSSTRLLYYDLGMRADDDGFVAARSVVLAIGLCPYGDDLKILIAKGFVKQIDESRFQIVDWSINNPKLRKV